MAGFLPFSAIYIELHYIFASVWGHKLYTLYGILFIAFGMLIINDSHTPSPRPAKAHAAVAELSHFEIGAAQFFLDHQDSEALRAAAKASRCQADWPLLISCQLRLVKSRNRLDEACRCRQR